MSKKGMTQLCFSKSEAHWNIIIEKISKKGKKNLDNYLRSETKKLLTKFNECPPCLLKEKTNKIKKRPYVSTDVLEELNYVCAVAELNVTDLIDYFILTPLLLEK